MCGDLFFGSHHDSHCSHHLLVEEVGDSYCTEDVVGDDGVEV